LKPVDAAKKNQTGGSEPTPAEEIRIRLGTASKAGVSQKGCRMSETGMGKGVTWFWG